MLYQALMFLVMTLVGGVVALAGMAGAVAVTGQVLLFCLLLFVVVSLVAEMLRQTR